MTRRKQEAMEEVQFEDPIEAEDSRGSPSQTHAKRARSEEHDEEGEQEQNSPKAAGEEEGGKKKRAVEAREDEDDDRSNALKLRFPYARVKAMIELDPELGKFRKESVKLIAKAGELFVAHLTQQAWHNTQVAGRKTLKPDDIEKAVNDLDCAEFLRVSFQK